MPIAPGGHAIMIRVILPETLMEIIQDWVNERPDVRASKLADAHITLVYVGKDLDTSAHNAILDAGKAAAEYLVRSNAFFGARENDAWAMFGGEQDKLVVKVLPTERLLEARKIASKALVDAGVKPKGEFGAYNPHVTLAQAEAKSARTFGQPHPRTWPKLWDGSRLLEYASVEVKLGSTRTVV